MHVQAANKPSDAQRAAEKRAQQAEARLTKATADRDMAVARETAVAREAATVRAAWRKELARSREQIQASHCPSCNRHCALPTNATATELLVQR